MLRSIASAAWVLLLVSRGLGLGTERFDNEPFTDVANYKAWPNVMPVINDTHRVYHYWVNGAEGFYFAGDTAALNVALKNFAAIQAERLVLVLRPAPGKTESFHGKSVAFNWNLHLLGGISKSMSRQDFGSNIWDPNPYLYVYVGDAIKLDEIKIPQGVEVLEIADLQTRYAKCLASKDSGVRGWSCGHIAGLDPYNADSMRQIATKLDDKDNWVKLNAAGALAHFTSRADEVIQKLKTVETSDKHLQERIQKSIEALQKAPPNEAARKEHEQSLASIHTFVVAQRQKR